MISFFVTTVLAPICFKIHVQQTVRKYRARLIADDVGSYGDAHIEQTVGRLMATGYDRWKKRLDPELYSPIVGPVDHSDLPQVG